MKIIICDDSIEDLLEIEKILLKYKRQHPEQDFVLEKFSNPSKLYHNILEGKMADIYILDMLMPEQTGIDLGGQIRKFGNGNVIIYITSSDDFALDAYEVHAVRYLLKPIDENKLFEALDYALSYTMIKQEPMYMVKTKDGLVQTPYSRIEYIENVYRKLEVHLIDGKVLKSLFIRSSFEETVHEIVEKKNFLQIHKSFIVNLAYAKRLTIDNIIMESGKQLPISKARAAEVKRKYLLFVSGKYR